MSSTSISVHCNTDASNTLALILAGGNGTRLGGLTACRPKPVVHVAGKYRCIDFTLSNCLHSGIRRIAVLSQFQADTLEEYLQSFWQLLRSQCGEFVDTWPSEQGVDGQRYHGTADAVRRNCDRIRKIAPSYVIVLAADHVYKMDYRDMLATHIKNNADMTIGSVDLPRTQAQGLGVLTVDDAGCVSRFHEKPAELGSIPGSPDMVCASMGIYVFSTDVLLEILERDVSEETSAHDFGSDVIPMLMRNRRLVAHRFRDGLQAAGYWRDIGTIDTLWQANMDAIGSRSWIRLADPDWPIWTYEPQYPPALSCSSEGAHDGVVSNTLISNGCIVCGATVEQSVLSCDVRVGEGSVVRQSVLMPHVRVGRNCRILRAIVDENCMIPDGFQVGYDREYDGDRFEVSANGIAVVTQAALQRVCAQARATSTPVSDPANTMRRDTVGLH